MKRKKGNFSGLLALIIGLSLVFNWQAAYAGTTGQQKMRQASEYADADLEQAPAASQEEAPEDKSSEQDEPAPAAQDAEPEEPEKEPSQDPAPDDASAQTNEQEEPEVPEAEPSVSEDAENDDVEDGDIVDGNLWEMSTQDEAKGATSLPTKMWVESSETNGLPVQINVLESSKSGNTRTCGLYLPSNAVLSNCFLFWDGGMSITFAGTVYMSGELKIPSLKTETTYTFGSGMNTASFKVTAYQGSVEPIFIEIEENDVNGYINIMNTDESHEAYCSGTIHIDNKWHELSKIKGRGNYTWKVALTHDKHAYNITIGDEKINFPGVKSDKTKKWSLLAEVGDRSLMCNRAGFKLANQLGVGQDTASADLWMNGIYQGCFTVTPKTDSFVTKDGYMIEEDNYLEPDGGDYQFSVNGINGGGNDSSHYNLFTIKEMGSNWNGRESEIQEWFQDAWDAISAANGTNSKGKYYTDYIDIESFAKMYLMTEYVKSYDALAGSILFHRDGMTDDDKLIAGPVWDLDNAMGSTQNNGNMNNGNNEGDRRSGKGEFLSVIKEYKTSIFIALYKHEDFKQEVKLQYNKHFSAFRDLGETVGNMKTAISASATMNHAKVEKVDEYNLHKYSNATTLEQYDSEFRQEMKKTSVWSDYADNLITYINARSKWFENKFYDEILACEHTYVEEIVKEATCKEAGTVKYTCSKCGDTYEETIPKLAHNYVDGYCTVGGEKVYSIDFVCDPGVSVTVYNTKDLTGDKVENATSVPPRSSKTGEIDCDGDGQVNFVVVLEDGYELVDVIAEPTTSFKNLKNDPEEDGNNSYYRLTKVNGDITVTVQAQSTTKPEFKVQSLILSGKIGVNFFLNLPELEGVDYSESYMEFTGNGIDSTVNFDPNFKNSSGKYYGFTCYVNSIQMAEPITAVFHYGDGQTVSTTKSVEDYFVSFHKNIGKYDAKTIALVESVQDYGYYAQIFLSDVNHWIIGTDYKAMATPPTTSYDLTTIRDAVNDYTVSKTGNDTNIDGITYNLSLDSGTDIYVNFKPIDDFEGDITFTVNGSPATVNELSDGRYQVRITDISAHELSNYYNVVATSTGGSTTVMVSALSYVRNMVNKDDVKFQNAGAAIYSYSTAADNYINSKTQ